MYPSGKLYFVERGDLSRLNDQHHSCLLWLAVRETIRACHENSSDEEEGASHENGLAECVVLDLSEGQPLLGLLAAKEGASLVQVASCPGYYEELVNSLAVANGVGTVLVLKEMDPVTVTRVPWDVVAIEPVSPQGTLRPQSLLALELLRWEACIPCCRLFVIVPFAQSVLSWWRWVEL